MLVLALGVVVAATLVVLLGVPGAGKSTWAAAHAAELGARVVSFDALRWAGERRQDVGAFRERGRRRVERELAAGRSVVVDAPNLERVDRVRWLGMARRHGAVTRLVVVTPGALSVAVDRQLEREGRDEPAVPAGAMGRYWRLFVRAGGQVRREPWGSVELVRTAHRVDAVAV